MNDTLRVVIEKSGLSRNELAQIYGVKRETMHYWRVRGKAKYETHASQQEPLITAALMEAINKKLLPLPALSKAMRKQRVAAMARTCQSLKPA